LVYQPFLQTVELFPLNYMEKQPKLKQIFVTLQPENRYIQTQKD